MKRFAFAFGVVVIIIGFCASFIQAEDCVSIDIELPAIVVGGSGAFADGYFELTNCGDEAGAVILSFDLDLNGTPFTFGDIPVMLGAGETQSRQFSIPVPSLPFDYYISMCVTASFGTSSMSDCATTTITQSGAASDDDGKMSIGFASYANANECVDLDFELPDQVVAGSGEFAEGYFEIINCGDNAATINMSVSMDISIYGQDTTFTLGEIPIELGAGEAVSHDVKFPVPSVVPAGTYGICITAVSGESMVTACQTVEVVQGSQSSSTQGRYGLQEITNYPNPFNPQTKIDFTLENASPVTVSVYNLLGQKVTTLLNDDLSVGPHSVTWDGTTNDGNPVASGIYFYRIETQEGSVSKRMILMQ